MARTIQVKADAFEGSGEFAPIPAGTKLLASIFEVEEGKSGPNSKNPGSPQFVYTAKVTEDFEFQYTDSQGNIKTANAKGREIKYNYVPLDPNVKHAWNLVAFAEAVGWKADPETGIEIPDVLSEVCGTEVLIQVDTQVDQRDPSKVYNRVRRISKASKVPQKKVEQAPSWSDV